MEKCHFHLILANSLSSQAFYGIYDSKTSLQEVVQARYKEPLTYNLISEKGPDHAKEFTVEAVVGDKVLGQGKGRTKKAAEQEAAYEGLVRLHQEEAINII